MYVHGYGCAYSVYTSGLTNCLEHPTRKLLTQHFCIYHPVSCILHSNSLKNQHGESGMVYTTIIQVYTCIYYAYTSNIQLYIHTYHVCTVYTACTLFIITLHFQSGPLSLATPASLSSALGALLQSGILPDRSLHNSIGHFAARVYHWNGQLAEQGMKSFKTKPVMNLLMASSVSSALGLSSK